MSDQLFDIPSPDPIKVNGETRGFPVGRIFCVGRNYAAHAAEMGVEVDREAPFYFTKTPTAATPSGSTIPYPPGTDNFHYEMELAVAIGGDGFRVAAADAHGLIYAYGCALDMTRRDLQTAAKAKQRPWDLGKDVEQSAIFAPLTRASDITLSGDARIHMEVNGEIRQDAQVKDMIHGIPEIIADLSKYYHLRPGDLILTGTPAGVGAVVAGDKITGGITGLDPIALTIGAPE